MDTSPQPSPQVEGGKEKGKIKERQMGLAASQIRYLFLTDRKADCEYRISIDAAEKMALTREQSNLSSQYYARLQNKNVSYYADGRYNKMNYQYLMGYGSNYLAVVNGNQPLKEDNSMILTDYNGLVVLNNNYAGILQKVLGSGCVDKNGRGSTFSKDSIPQILAELIPGFSAEQFQNIINGGEEPSSYPADIVDSLTGEITGSTTCDNTSKVTDTLKKVVDFYYPIFLAASANGWTTEYNNEMKTNDNYISDALVSGTFQLAQVNDYGGYNPDTSLTYFVLQGLVVSRQDSDVREEITAWYNAEKERIAEKESWIDLDMQDLSTELEAIKTEMESVKSIINDNTEVFDWGNA